MSRSRATLIGATAILMWSLLALLTRGSEPVPPLLLNTLCFSIGGVIGLIWTARRGFSVLAGISWRVYAFGTVGLFGYHFLYFTAWRLAPVAETGLIAYLWPLLIVLMSGLLPGERLNRWHILGALIAFAGAAVILLARPSQDAVDPLGFVLAFGCALLWSSYSVISRRLGDVPTECVTVYCLLTAALSLPAHLWLEPSVWPVQAAGWLSILLLGLGPVGLAFFTWDLGMKKGDIQLLGVASYAAPLLSTLILVVAGAAQPSWALLAAAVLITAGAALATLKKG